MVFKSQMSSNTTEKDQEYRPAILPTSYFDRFNDQTTEHTLADFVCDPSV